MGEKRRPHNPRGDPLKKGCAKIITPGGKTQRGGSHPGRKKPRRIRGKPSRSRRGARSKKASL